MRLDLGSFAFGSSIKSGGNTPSWGTSLGQVKPDLKLTYPGYDNIVIGMVNKSIPVDKVFIPLGKGGHVCNSLEDEGILLAALFDKVYVNEVRVNSPFILLIYKEDSNSWAGRKTLKYNIKIEYRRGENDIVSNSDFVSAAIDALQINEDACWVISDIFIVNQDELHMVAGIVNPNQSEVYPSTEVRKTAFLEAINTTYEENPHFKSRYSTGDVSGYDATQNDQEEHDSIQQIFYGAPGTGKSNKIKEQVDDKGKIHFRTTFHPDSDYSTFVGCYKPKSHKKNMLSGNGINETQLLSCFFNSNGPEYKGKNKARYLYEALVHTKDIQDLGLDAQTVSDKLVAKGFKGCAYTTEATCMYNIYEWLKEDGHIVENKLSYEFTPQCFVKAYIEAWKQQQSGTPVYLIIEEINRGNCAQIFGDLFQLLDRDDDGFSRYEVIPDSDLQDYIKEVGLNISDILDSEGNDISASIANGDILKLPNNLYIWATMNTSDQSLFPIDSAFKRRWDWVYMPIDTKKETWFIKVGEKHYSWTDFLEKINNDILTDETAEDKHLGFYFCKAENNEISQETFVGKVLFYLWNDVFKVYGIPTVLGSSKEWAYTKFYNPDGSVNEQKVIDFMSKLQIKPEGSDEDPEEKTDEQ